MEIMVRLIIYIFMFNTSVLAQFYPNPIDGFVQEHFPWRFPFFTINLTMPVMTTKGFVQGKLVTTVGKGVKYSSFLGIPFAQPPVGSLRFKPPQEANPWGGLYQATEQKNDCPQLEVTSGAIIGKEDCLYLNVYTPKISITDMKRRSVMVWIYGGGFVSGTSSPKSYGPDFLIDEDVLVVAMNYRLGALGFLFLNHTNATGNAGLKDQKMALEWVQQNIENFGGDPKKVTIFGQSAGSVGTMYQVLSEASNGLFRSAIAMSGSPLNPWGFTPPAEAVSRAFAVGRALGVDTTDASILLQKLHTFSAEELVLALTKVANIFAPYLTPTIENSKAESPFLTRCSVDKLATGSFNQVPLMLGFTNLEALSFIGFNEIARDGMIEGCLESIRNISELQNTEQVLFLREAQTRSKNNETFTDDDLCRISNITSDILFSYGIDRTQQFLASKVPVYYYRNSFDYPQSLHRLWGININGTGHEDDVQELFWVANHNQSLDPNSEIGIQRTKMVKMWTNFAKYGNPTPGDLDPVLTINWPVSDSEGTCLEIDKNYTVGKRPIDDFVRFLHRVRECSLGEENGCQ